jgi:DNA (cytosine-5)-methyltransferase 1
MALYNSATLDVARGNPVTELTKYGPRYTIADTFCGCGGLSLGFSLTHRFETLLGLDIKPEALETFAHNHERFEGKRPVTIREDIQQVDHDAFSLRDADNQSREIDCLIGGPPCEGFSQNRTVLSNGARTHKFIDDPRNQLFSWFVDLAAKLQPKVVLIENVPDLIRHRDGETRNDVLAALDEAGYVATARVLNAADYGVPQMRRRAFFLAQRKRDLATHGIRLDFPAPTHRPYPMMHPSLMNDPDWLPGDSGYWVSVREAIGDLPRAVTAEEGDLCGPYPAATMTAFRAQMRSPTSLVYNHIARKLGKGGLERVRALRPGQLCADLPNHLRPKGHYHYCYTRLIWSEPARTITKFAYHVGSGQFAHPETDRAITMREAARLQSFPDDFRFLGTNEIRKISSLIGSAVPPFLAKAIARQVAQYLDMLYLAHMTPEERRSAKILAGDAVLRRMEREEWSNEEEGSEAVLRREELVHRPKGTRAAVDTEDEETQLGMFET